MPLAAHPALAKALEAELARGPMPFRRFMELALYHPEGGYYAQPRPRIGAAGDFLTSPHQSPWFGRMAARQLEALWEAMGGPIRYTPVEQGAAARERLRERLAPWPASVRFPGSPLDRWMPGSGFEGAVLAHEFLDALPVHLLVQTEAGLKECYVERRGEGLAFCEGSLSDSRLAGWFGRLGVKLAPGQRAEARPAAAEWIGAIAPKLRRGAILNWDYG
ncbi:MAG: SAM-dependent methyltransferase, partial [Candidatus Tectomicrobia bacterium]|nr:SAM-dependent methyltransferase [Candidatus Tectomicrobia bacterium]